MKIRVDRNFKILLLHINVFFFSLSGVFSKLAAQNFGNYQFYLFFSLLLLNCIIYAVFWQINLKHFSVSFAYLNRSVYIIWTMLWAFLCFREQISLTNYVGAGLIIIGIIVIYYKK